MAGGYIIPALGEWMERSKERAQAPGRQRALEQAETLMGAPAREAYSRTDEQGLTTGFESFGGTGLMQDPNDFYNQMQYAQGLMTTPYFEQAGQNAMSQSMDQMLQAPRMAAESKLAQENWQKNYQQQQQQNMAQRQQAAATRAAADSVARANQTGALYKDAQALLKGPRESIKLFDNVQTTVRLKGFSGMNITDDTVMIKSLAKILLPEEAVMEGDISALATMEGIPAAVKSLAAKAGAGWELLPEERQQLYDQLFQLGQQKMGQIQSDRGDFTERATRRGMNINDVLPSALTPDMTNRRSGQKLSPELNATLDAQYEAENPGLGDQVADWLSGLIPGRD